MEAVFPEQAQALYAGFQELYQHPATVKDVRCYSSVGRNAFKEEDGLWLEATYDYLEGQLDDAERAKRMLPAKKVHILHILHILHFLHINDFFVVCRYVLRGSQPVYGFWYYFMIHRAIGINIQKILPRFVPRTDFAVDALRDCKLRVYVLHILHI